MINDARDIGDNTEIRGSIAIIGAGAAGITLAIELAQHFKDVLLLESGGFDFEPDTQRLYDGPVIGYKNTDISSSRLRFLGGTTNIWNGQCAPFDAVDFERLPERPYSGWPFQLDKLMPFYERAYPYCELGTFRSTPADLDRVLPTARRVYENPELELTEFRLSPPTRFGERYRSQLKSSDRIKIYLHANVVNISISDSGNSVSLLEVQTLTGQKLKVTAAAVVLCCGGVENARILLNCTDYFSTGIGNEHDLVGRYFMDHLVAHGGSIIPQNEAFDFVPMTFHRDGLTPVWVALKNSADTIRHRGRAGCSLFLKPESEMTEHFLRATESPAFQAFRELVRNARLGHFPRELGERECAALEDTGSIVTALYGRMAELYWNKRALKTIAVHVEAEQSPNPDSRVVLINDVDALGMRRAGLDWRISDEDRNNIYQSAMALARGVGAAAFGRMIITFEATDNPSIISTAWHHMGTTRMHDDKQQGVVDQNCKIHNLKNLFIAGSSIFPTGGRPNPTLTITALAIRLADHLKLTVRST